MSTRVQSITSLGSDGLIADIECRLSNSLPGIVIVGFANKAVDEAKERIRGTFANSHCNCRASASPSIWRPPMSPKTVVALTWPLPQPF